MKRVKGILVLVFLFFIILNIPGTGRAANTAFIYQNQDNQEALIDQSGNKNDGYIHQEGLNDDAFIYQIGYGNFATIEQIGDLKENNYTDITQEGDNNLATQGQITPASAGSDFIIQQYGDNNDANQEGYDNGFIADIYQDGNKNIAYQMQEEIDNSLFIRQDGS